MLRILPSSGVAEYVLRSRSREGFRDLLAKPGDFGRNCEVLRKRPWLVESKADSFLLSLSTV